MTLQRLTDILLEEYKVPDAAVNKYRLKTLKPFDVAYDVKRNVDAAMARSEVLSIPRFFVKYLSSILLDFRGFQSYLP